MYFHQHFLLHIYFYQHSLVHLHLLSQTLPGTSTSTCTNIVWYIYTIYFHHLPGATAPTFTNTALYNYNIYLVHLLSPILPCTTSSFTHIALYNYNIYFHQYCLVQQQHLPGTSTPTFTNFHQDCLVQLQQLLSPALTDQCNVPFHQGFLTHAKAPSSTFTNTHW